MYLNLTLDSSRALISQNENEAAALLTGIKVAAPLAMPVNLTINQIITRGETTQVHFVKLALFQVKTQ